MPPSTLLALVAAAATRAAVAGPPRVLLDVPARASARVGAVRLDVALRNASREPLRADGDPERLRVSVRDSSGAALPCSPPGAGPGAPTALAPGARLALALDLGARCRIEAPGAYAVEVRYEGPGGPAAGSSVLRVTRWSNPGIRPPLRGQRTNVTDTSTEW